MIGALAFAMLASHAWAEDPVSNRSPTKTNKLTTVAITPGEETIVYTQMIGDAPGMNEMRNDDQDFGWTHTLDAPYSYIQWSDLTIVAADVQYDYGERDLVSADGQVLGPLYGPGWANRWSTTFAVPISLLSDGKLNVWVDIDSTHQGRWVLIESSTFRVAYVLRLDRDEAFRKMDEAWSAMSAAQQAAAVRSEAAFNRFTAQYATLTGRQVANLVEEVKSMNPAYMAINSRLMKALIAVESSNNFLALSSAGALGLGQKLTGQINARPAFQDLRANLNLSNFKYHALALDDRTIPERGIGMSLDYVAYLSNRPFINGDVDKILAAYNGGEGRLYGILKDPKKRDQWLNYFPKETRDYVPRIKKQVGIK